MKELTLQLEDMDEQAAQDFLVEIRLMNALRHSRVVRFEGVAFNEGQLYLVTVCIAVLAALVVSSLTCLAGTDAIRQREGCHAEKRQEPLLEGSDEALA